MKRMGVMGVVLLWLIWPLTVAGQTVHPCDAPPQTVATKGTAIGWCHDLKDDQGFVDPSIAFKVTVNAVQADLGVLVPVGNPSPTTGLYYFMAPLLNAGLGRGLYPVHVEAYNTEGVSPPSNTVTWQIGGPPNKPQNPRVAM